MVHPTSHRGSRFLRAVSCRPDRCQAAVLGLPALTAAAGAADPLLSQGKPATASSTENAGTPAAAAVDGNTGTRWSSAFSDPQWIQVDLGATATISQVALQLGGRLRAGPSRSRSRPTATDLDHRSTRTTTGTGGTQTLTVTGTGRYVRMNGTARATEYGYSLWEFQVYGTLGGDTGGLRHRQRRAGPAGHRLLDRERRHPGVAPRSTATPAPAGRAPSATPVAAGRPRRSAAICQVVLTGRPPTRRRSRSRSSQRHATWTDDLLHHHRHRRHPDARRHRHRPLRPDVRHRTGHRVRLLAVGVPGPCPRHRRQRHRRAARRRRRRASAPTCIVFDPSMSAATDPEPGRHDLHAQQESNQFGSQRYVLLFKPGTYNGLNVQVGFYTSVAGPRPEPATTSRSTATSPSTPAGSTATRPRTSGGRRRTSRSTRSAGTDRWAVSQAAPFRRMRRPRRPQPGPERLRLGLRRLHRRLADQRLRGPVLAAAVVHPRQPDRRRDQRRLEHGVLGRAGRAGAELPEPAVHHDRHHAGHPGEAVPVPRPAAPTRCSCRRCGPTPPA